MFSRSTIDINSDIADGSAHPDQSAISVNTWSVLTTVGGGEFISADSS